MGKNGPMVIERSWNIHATRHSLHPLSLYNGPTWSFARQERTPYSNRAWVIKCWTLESSLKQHWLPSWAILQAWTKDWECILWRSIGGSLPFPSLFSFSAMMKQGNTSFVATLEAGLNKKHTIKEIPLFHNSNYLITWWCQLYQEISILSN